MVRMTKGVAVAAKPGRGNVPSTSEIHVLAVDDSLVDRKVIEKLLKTSSYKVTAVDSALRALELLGIVDGESSSATNGIQIHMIITDYCMPQMTGYDLLKRVKGTSALKEIPVVIMSSENVETRINSCYEEGAEDFIIKPVRLADVKRLGSHFSREEKDLSTTKEALGSMTRKKRKRSEVRLQATKESASERRSQSMRLTVP